MIGCNTEPKYILEIDVTYYDRWKIFEIGRLLPMNAEQAEMPCYFVSKAITVVNSYYVVLLFSFHDSLKN